MFREAALRGQQQELEPAYVACSSPPVSSPSLVESSKSLDSLDGTSNHFAQNDGDHGMVPGIGPVKVSVKNTFIQFEVPASPKGSSEPPLRTAPGNYFQKFFRTREPEDVDAALPSWQACPTPTAGSGTDDGFPFGDAAVTTTLASTPFLNLDKENVSSGAQAHALGQCTPCAYFWYKKDGCRKGDECQFCHLCQKGEIKRRKKQRVQQLKAVGAFIPGFSKMQEVMQ